MSRWTRLMLWGVVGTAVTGGAGCAAITRPPATVASLQLDAVPLAARDRMLRDSVIARLVRRVERRGDRTLDLLLLSGGGQNGAFGAGFLRGWRSRVDAPMPTFDLVSGISTGALQAPFALMGTPEALDTVSALYARSATTFAPTIDWWFWARPTGGLVKTDRYERTLTTALAQYEAPLRTAFRDDRQLLTATTDFDLGIGRLWSLGDEPLDGGRWVRLLRAATAIPAVIPPVIIDGHVHADGGVVENVLGVLTFEDYQALGKALEARGVRDVQVRVWVVMNIWTHAEPRALRPSSRRQLDGRSTALLFYLHQSATLAGLSNLARAVSEQVPGVRMDLRMSLLPSGESLVPGAQKLFDQRFMQRLDSIGFAKARSAMPWDVVPSAYVRPLP